MADTASSLERELRCPASAVLTPQVHSSGEDAERGHALHGFCRDVIAGTPRVLALSKITTPPWRETAEQIDFGILCGGLTQVRAEVSYRIDLDTDTVRELGMNLNRRYPPRGPHDVDGSNDFEGRKLMTGTWSVTDMKFGFWPVTPCSMNAQMMFHAKALMMAKDVNEVEARIAYIAVDGGIRFDPHLFTRFELDSYGDDLMARYAARDRAREMLERGEIEVFAGNHCRYCPSMHACPKFTTLAHSMVGELRLMHKVWGRLSEQEKAVAFLKAYEARNLAVEIVEEMKMIARDHPISLGEGKVLMETPSGVRIVGKKPGRSR